MIISPGSYTDFYFRDADGFVKINQQFPFDPSQPITPALRHWENGAWLVNDVYPFHELWVRAHDGWVFVGYYGDAYPVDRFNIFNTGLRAYRELVNPVDGMAAIDYPLLMSGGTHLNVAFSWANPLDIRRYVGRRDGVAVQGQSTKSIVIFDTDILLQNTTTVVAGKTLTPLSATLTFSKTFAGGSSLITNSPWSEISPGWIQSVNENPCCHIYRIPISLCGTKTIPELPGVTLPKKMPKIYDIITQGTKLASFSYDTPIAYPLQNSPQQVNVNPDWLDDNGMIALACVMAVPISLDGEYDGSLGSTAASRWSDLTGTVPLPFNWNVWFYTYVDVDIEIEGWLGVQP